MNIYLIGFMGTGKSTIARYLKREQGMKLVEMDEEIEEREGCTIREMFAEHGEQYFRDLETTLLEEVANEDGVVVSCGGGVVLRPGNVELMKESGKIILLTATPETILQRVKGNENRPLLKGKKTIEGIQELMEKRRACYECAADQMISVDKKSVQQIGKEVLHAIQG